ncbi:MAG: hypothetical protein KDE19_11290 [Caldilineaceae bacterium]|nr:hypothetical protein [Caldilineaceae bacterium]
MTTLQISLFGTLKCFYDDRLLELDARKAQELLCYLLLHPTQQHEREKLATLLWLDKSAPHSKKYLRQALWQLQTALDIGPTCPPLLLVDHQHIGIHPAADYWLDVAVFEQAFFAVEKQSGQQLEEKQVEMLQSVLPLYTADLLDGWYTDWSIYARERYQTMYLSLLDKLTEYLEVHHQYAAAIAYAESMLQYDRARERTHRQLMRLHYLTGHRTAALHQYDACVAALDEELSVPPAQSTVALYEEICADQFSLPGRKSDSTPTKGKDPTNLPRTTLHELQQIRSTLSALQNQVTQLIYHLEQR